MTLTLEELRAAVPEELHHFIEDCDMDGCDVDFFGIPLCIPVPDRLQIIPFCRQALDEMNATDV